MTEEDTFNALKREPYERVHARINSDRLMGENNYQIVVSNGWSPTEYLSEFYRRSIYHKEMESESEFIARCSQNWGWIPQ